jgi:hypothetical protein
MVKLPASERETYTRQDGDATLSLRFGSGNFERRLVGIRILANCLFLVIWHSWMTFALCELMQRQALMVAFMGCAGTL